MLAATNAAVISDCDPEITTAFVTVTTPDVAAPIALRSVASIAVASASVMVTVAVLLVVLPNVSFRFATVSDCAAEITEEEEEEDPPAAPASANNPRPA